MSAIGYNTNLAAEFYVLSVLHRFGMTANLTLGNKKSVDILIYLDSGVTLTVDVKGLAGTSNWPIDNLKVGRIGHFIVFVTFLDMITDPNVLPEVYIVPSEKVSTQPPLIKPVYRNPAETRTVVQYRQARGLWEQYKNAWHLLGCQQ